MRWTQLPTFGQSVLIATQWSINVTHRSLLKRPVPWCPLSDDAIFGRIVRVGAPPER